MKKQRNSLTIKLNKGKTDPTNKEIASLLLPGILLLAGFWGMAAQEWQLGVQGYLMLLPALLALGTGLFLRWEKKWHAWSVIGLLTAVAILSVVFRQQFSESIAALLQQMAQWRLMRTGTYTAPFETVGSLWPILLVSAVFSGLGTAWILRTQSPIWQLVVTLTVLISWMSGLLESGWPLGVYLAGALLIFVKYASGLGKTVFWAGSIVLTSAACLLGGMLIFGFETEEMAAGNRLAAGLHDLYWEESENPLPEGCLSKLGAYKPSDEAAMELTMQHWTPVYLRGFVAGEYSDNGWKQLEPQKLLENADILYALQENHFYASDQAYAAWQSVGAESDNHVSINILGACHAHTYLPYSAGNITEGVLESCKLQSEGTAAPDQTAYEMELYPVENSYLLQGELVSAQAGAYRSAEAAYRKWVYEQYVSIPESVYEILGKYFTVNGEITTVEAKQKITELLGERLTYQENVLTDSGKRNFPSYVLEVSQEGYSVHYATLATLLLRSCGIPARYVEGYVVTPSQAEALADGETLTLTQRNAHAWTEYYLDGVGWIPFDATPGYDEIIEYELPPNGTPAGDSGVSMNPMTLEEQKDTPLKTPQVEEEKTKLSQQIYIREAVLSLLLLLLSAIILYVVRTLIVRHKLRMHQETFYGSDCRKACAGILCYMQELAGALELQTDRADVTAKAKIMVSMLGECVDAQALENTINEVWFSNHTITPKQQETALVWLETAKQTWKQKVPAAKRFKQRFITCKIL